MPFYSIYADTHLSLNRRIYCGLAKLNASERMYPLNKSHDDLICEGFAKEREGIFATNNRHMYVSKEVADPILDAQVQDKADLMRNSDLVGKAYKFMVLYEDDELTDVGDTDARIRAFAREETHAILSCEVRIKSVNNLRIKWNVAMEITSIQQCSYFGSEGEFVGNIVNALPYWCDIEKNGDFGDCEVAINDGGCLNCGGGYTVLCVPLELWQTCSTDAGKSEKILRGARDLAAYLEEEYGISVSSQRIAEFFED